MTFASMQPPATTPSPVALPDEPGPEYIRQDIALEMEFANELLAHGLDCDEPYIEEPAKIVHQAGSYVHTELVCSCGHTFSKPNSAVRDAGTIKAQADVNLRTCLALRLSKINISRFREFEIKSGMTHVMCHRSISDNLHKIWELAVHPECERVLQENRRLAITEARDSDDYIGDTTIIGSDGQAIDVPSLQTIADGVYCTRSLGKRNYARASTAFWCVYSIRGLPLYIHRHQISCTKCTYHFKRHSNFDHEGRCWRTTKGCTSITLAESIGSAQLGQDIKDGTIGFCPYNFIGDGDSGAFSALQKTLGVDIAKTNCNGHVKRNGVGELQDITRSMQGFTYNRYVRKHDVV
jgi:hypothetical protein